MVACVLRNRCCPRSILSTYPIDTLLRYQAHDETMMTDAYGFYDRYNINHDEELKRDEIIANSLNNLLET